MNASEAAFCNSSEREYPPEEWRITGELIRQIGKATTWQRVVEAGDALMAVSRMAKSMRDEDALHRQAAIRAADSQSAQVNQQAQPRSLICLGEHTWIGPPESCCPVCNRRASADAPKQ